MKIDEEKLQSNTAVALDIASKAFIKADIHLANIKAIAILASSVTGEIDQEKTLAKMVKAIDITTKAMGDGNWPMDAETIAILACRVIREIDEQIH